MSYAFCVQQDIENAFYYALFVFSATLLTYNAQRIIKRSQDKKEWDTGRLLWLKQHSKLLYILSILSSILCLIIYFQHLYHLHSFIFLIPLAFISIFYALKLGNLKNLREIPHVKIHLIALVWVSSTCIFPALNEELLSWNSFLFGAAFYLYILAITVPFDIRDLNYDDPNSKTVPQVFGIDLAKKIALITLISSACIFSYLSTNLLQQSLLTIALIYQAVLIQLTTKNKPELFYSGLIDGGIILLAISFCSVP
ncbi:hypothetical protein SAMN05216474_2710 [Lishizhenia tianjinensis]|uniref:UbiA prenyltransferase family protein n=2 Tax=Lishizhenia tianjinensis TaxID=477690 RepID=A0A1I7BDX8_9FLAO|nr:hypothetical protein SAMN05216474_2710 [Lishizhenia tianjinensis]